VGCADAWKIQSRAHVAWHRSSEPEEEAPTSDLYQPVSSGQWPASSSDIEWKSGNFKGAQRRELVRDSVILDPEKAKDILQRERKDSREEGWCIVSTKKTNKANQEQGYVQVSVEGVNHVCLLHEVVLAAKDMCKDDVLKKASALGGGSTPAFAYDPDFERGQCSHLCNRPQCMVPDPIHLESAQANNARKGCLVWVVCRHCEKKKLRKRYIIVCPHEPNCIKFVPAFKDMDDLVANGQCDTDDESEEAMR